MNADQISLFEQIAGVFTEPEQTGDQSNTATNQVQPKKRKNAARKSRSESACAAHYPRANKSQVS